ALLEDCLDRLDADGRHYLQRVRAGSQRMDELIDDLLTLSRVTRAELRRMRVDLSAKADKVIAQLRQAHPDRLVDVMIGPDLAAQGDPKLLRVVLDNLLGNAWKYTNRKARARIEFGTVSDDGEHAYFVRDDGA